jgi:hypothetical protein
MQGLRQMTSVPEQIFDYGVYREEALGLAWRLEAAHLSLPFPCRLVREFRAAVGILLPVVHRGRRRVGLRRRVVSELVGDDPARPSTMSFRKLRKN